MKMSAFAWKTVAGFAAGIIAGVVLSQVRRSSPAARFARRTARLRADEPVQQQAKADRQEAKPAEDTKLSSGDTADEVVRGQRGGEHEQGGVQSLTKQQLYHEARRRNIRGRSTMTKAELRRALG